MERLAERSRGDLRPARPGRALAIVAGLAALVLSIVLAVVQGFVPVSAWADPKENYQLLQAYPADDYHIPILMYRERHTELPSKPEVSYVRTVAAFDFVHDGIKMVAVGPSIDRFPGHTKTALIDVYRQDPETGDWQLVDLSGKPLTLDGKPVDWRTSSVPSVTWDLSKETNPDVVNRLKYGVNAEHVMSMYLRLKLNGANETTKRGLVEQIPCETPGQMCKKNLEEGNLFPAIEQVEYVVDAPNLSQAKKQGIDKRFTAPQLKALLQARWEHVGMPTNAKDANGLGFRTFVTPDSEPSTGPAASALAPGSNPGGIDFSSLQLRYLSEAPGGKLDYAFAASGAKPSLHNVSEGRTAAVEASDAFFVWLSMPKSAFWVNLNPNQPNKIVDAKLGTTDVGRIMLQADFAMKKLVGKLIYPKSALGKKYWGNAHPGSCLDTRQWIVPAPATIYEHDGGISIINAPLNVKMESEYIKGQSKADSCVHPDARMEKAFRTLVLPKVVQAVNHAPQFAELRRVYLSRVAAEWYRTKHGQDGALRSLIDSGNVSAWPALQSWSPRRVFNQYVYAFKHKEFNVKVRRTKGNKVYTDIYTYGGVDFSQVPLHQASASAIQQQDPGLSRTVQQSFQHEVKGQGNTIWLGAVSRPYLPKPAGPQAAKAAGFPAADLAVVVVCGFAVVALVIGLILAIILARGNRRGLLVSAIAVLLVGSIITGAVALERGAVQAVRAAVPTSVPTSVPTTVPTTVPTGAPASPTAVASRRSSHPTSAPSKLTPKAKPKARHQPPRWSTPKRGHRPSSSMFALTWRKEDKAKLQRLDPLTFSFAIPRDYRCEAIPGVAYVFCGRGFDKKDPYVVIYPGTCGCTVKQVSKSVDTILHSKNAFGRLLPVDPYTRASDNGNGKARYQYWMVRVYGIGGSHRLDHQVFVYGQANNKADDVKIRKIIGDIYDATR